MDKQLKSQCFQEKGLNEDREVRSSPKENQSLEVKVKGISEMEFSLSIFDYTFTN